MAVFPKNKKAKEGVKTTPALSSTAGLNAPKFRIILKRPWLSEKALNMKSQNKFLFLVDIKANKKVVAQEVARKYSVKVAGVNMIRKPSKVKRFRRTVTRPADMKKAIVTLAAGQTIELI